jgi:phosphoglycolate phosphatase-like HAD superfamily hydrolase
MANNKIILWDIDGTLIKAGRNQASKHQKAIERVLDIDCYSDEKFDGSTDLEIIIKLLRLNDLKINEIGLKKIFKALDEISLNSLKSVPPVANDGISELLFEVQEYGWINGIQSGNSNNRSIAKIKKAKLNEFFYFPYTFSGDNYTSRIELIAGSKKILQSQSFTDILIVGDTPVDIMSAKKLDLPVIAMATGVYNEKELHKYEPNCLIRNLNQDYLLFTEYLNNNF